jgi:hypothetical protein
MEENKQAIMDKIAKMLILAKDQSGTNEGKNALKLASKLMAKHRIQESEIDLEQDALAEDRIMNAKDKGGWRQWIVSLSACLAKTFDCQTHFNNGYREEFSITFVGTVSDVETCTYFQEIVVDHVERGAWGLWSSERNWRKRNEFGQGAIYAVNQRLTEMKKAMTKEEKDMGLRCTDLVIAKNEVVVSAYEDAYPDLKTAKNRNVKITSRKNWMAGIEAGKNAPLSKGIDGNIEREALAI